MEFGAPHWLWLLVAAPLAVAVSTLAWRRRLRATASWAARGLWDRLLPTFRPRRLAASALLLALAAAATALTLARPRWGQPEQQLERRGLDVVFVLDTSLSMATRDLEPSRLWVAQTLIRQLVRELDGHRFALVQAEGDGVVMAPLTTDDAVIDMLLDAALPGSLPSPGTDLGPALEHARALIPAGGERRGALVLVSDGEDHGSGFDPIAIQLRQDGIPVYALGVGTLEGKPLELPRTDGGSIEYKRDQAGHVVVSRLMEATLEQVSRDTGGIYLRAGSAAADLSPVVAGIEAMTRPGHGEQMTGVPGERFQWPAGAAILALALHLSTPPFGRKPKRDRP